MATPFRCTVWALLVGLCGAASTQIHPAAAQDLEPLHITVSAGAVDRLHTPVAFTPENGARCPGTLDESGRAIPVQSDPDGRCWIIVKGLMRGESRVYTLTDFEEAPSTSVALERAESDSSITFLAGGAPFLSYRFSPTRLPDEHVDPAYERGGYIHPVFSPNGVQLTDDYPPNHLHHHGVWAAWTKTRFEGRAPDFWNMGSETGKVEPVSLDSVWTGPVFAGLEAHHAYVDLTLPAPRKALEEDWMIRVFPVLEDGIRMFDLIVTHSTAGDDTLHLPEYHYGGVGFRGNRQWDGEENTFFLTSEGKDRSNGHATRARWCHIGGYVDGRLAGIAVLDHPENFRSPQPMRIHPNEPFFNYAPSQLGEWSIEPGEVYTVRYRFITYDGEPDPRIIDRLWNDFADPPVVSIGYE